MGFVKTHRGLMLTWMPNPDTHEFRHRVGLALCVEPGQRIPLNSLQ